MLFQQMNILHQTQRRQQRDKSSRWRQVHRVIDTLWINQHSYITGNYSSTPQDMDTKDIFIYIPLCKYLNKFLSKSFTDFVFTHAPCGDCTLIFPFHIASLFTLTVYDVMHTLKVPHPTQSRHVF